MSVRGATRGRRPRPAPTAPVEALASLPVGPQLAAALAELDETELSGHDVVLFLQALQRQVNHYGGRRFAAVGEVMLRRDPDYGRYEPPPPTCGDGYLADEIGSAEVRAALVLTRRKANETCSLAGDLLARLPQVRDAMTSGVLDLARATILSDWTADLAERHARHLVDALLPVAPNLTTAQLITAIQKAAIDLDPQWARRRYENSLKSRDVRAVIRLDGTAELSGTCLPADEVAAAADRLDALARRLKQAGHPALLRHLRADIFLGRHGKYLGMDDEQLFHHLIATMPHPEPFTESADQPTGTGDQDAARSAHPDSTAGADRDDRDRTPAQDHDPAPGPSPAPSPSREQGPSPAPGPSAAPGPSREQGRDPEPGTEPSGPANAPEPADPATDRPGADAGPVADPAGPDSGSTVETAFGAPAVPSATCAPGRGKGLRLLAGLGTIAGCDERPGELLGFGYLIAPVARRLTAAPHASWYLALTEPDGTPLSIGMIRRRPTTAWADTPTSSGRVEAWLQLTRDELVRLLEHPPPGWERVITELAQHASGSAVGPPNGDPSARIPGDLLRRWINIRDRYCVYPGCRVPAHRTEADHTVEHSRGGPTADRNLGSCCGPHHALRHKRGWQLEQPSVGQFVWTSPLGHRYERATMFGPGQAPMPEPTRPDEDDFAIQTLDTWNGPATCAQVETPPTPRAPEPKPEPPPKPRRSGVDVIPF